MPHASRLPLRSSRCLALLACSLVACGGSKPPPPENPDPPPENPCPDAGIKPELRCAP
ncbi:MAG: hypothetical protein ABW123_27385 [Cystobacter sp.]